MAHRLTDILDLEFLINLDNELADKTSLEQRLQRDRSIYEKIRTRARSEQDLIWQWYAHRKEQFRTETLNDHPARLPGDAFSTVLYRMTMAMMAAGLLFGFILAGSFLAYHGNQPINVTVFFTLFVIIPFGLSCFALTGLILRRLSKNEIEAYSVLYIIPSLVKRVCFDLLLKKLKQVSTGLEKSSFSWMAHFDQLEFRYLFFWSFFILSCLSGVGFSMGALGAVFFKVLVSDMAFGWQSTLITSTQTVSDLVTTLAAPWAWLVSPEVAYPSFDQIQGSRIILKEGISVLATPDLISWWPFLCLSLLVYGLLPRICLTGLGAWIQHREVNAFEFKRPEIRLLIARMTSPVIEIEKPVQQEDEPEKSVGETVDSGPKETEPLVKGKTGLVLASDRVYSETGRSSAIKTIETLYGVRIGQSLDFVLNAPMTADFFEPLDLNDTDPVIILYEAWQPPIRGLLFSISNIRKILPDTVSLWIVLTNDAGLEDMSLGENDPQSDVWIQAVESLGEPMILVKRLVKS